MSKYEVIIYWTEDDQAFIAEVPELPGCAAHGATQVEALARLDALMQLEGGEAPSQRAARVVLETIASAKSKRPA